MQSSCAESRVQSPVLSPVRGVSFLLRREQSFTRPSSPAWLAWLEAFGSFLLRLAISLPDSPSICYHLVSTIHFILSQHHHRVPYRSRWEFKFWPGYPAYNRPLFLKATMGPLADSTASLMFTLKCSGFIDATLFQDGNL